MYNAGTSWFFQVVSNFLPMQARGTPPCFELCMDSHLMLGRRPDIHIFLPDTNVSREHALLHLTQDGCYIEDLRSFHGVAINGVLIKEKKRLQDGDLIALGPTTFLIAHQKLPKEPPPIKVSKPKAENVRVATVQTFVKMGCVPTFESATTELEFLLAARNARFRAWKKQGLPMEAAWVYYDTGKNKEGALWVKCTLCKIDSEDHLHELKGASCTAQYLSMIEDGVIEDLVMLGCRHLVLFEGNDPDEVTLLIEQEWLASRKFLN